MRHIHLIAAARPNFMKIAPLYHALEKEPGVKVTVVHTGQHYDLNMSDVFFRDLGLPSPDINLEVGGGSHAEQTGMTLIRYERVLLDSPPDLVVVVGDVNATVAAAIAATKLGIPVAHLEAGLRSFDRRMPEEINRLLTDVIADLLWTPSRDAGQNLRREGIPETKIRFVGNIMIDSLEMLRDKIETAGTYSSMGLTGRKYGVVTLHRPSNVDEPAKLEELCDLLIRVASRMPVYFPVHPRTKKNLEAFGLAAMLEQEPNLMISNGLNYVAFMNLVMNSRFVLTDSGGIQEETSYLGIPCFTLRSNTERPITITRGTNRLCSAGNVEGYIEALNEEEVGVPKELEFWDGATALRVLASIREFLGVGQDP